MAAGNDVEMPMPPLHPRDGNFDWLRKANDWESRTQRLQVAQDSLRASERGWYWYNGTPISLNAVEEMESGTVMITPKKKGPIAEPRSSTSPSAAQGTVVYRAKEAPTVLDCAVPLARLGKRVAVISAASAFQAGGGFETGGRHALEEAMCVQTTLFRALRRVRDEAKAKPGKPYIPAEAAVLCKRVEVFREGTSNGYVTLPGPVELACIVSIAMPNLNPQVHDSPAEKYTLARSYRAAIRARWRAALVAAYAAGANSLVVPDAGCGVFRNDPGVVGEELGSLLNNEGKGCVQEVWLVGGDKFCSSVGDACGGLREGPDLPPLKIEPPPAAGAPVTPSTSEGKFELTSDGANNPGVLEDPEYGKDSGQEDAGEKVALSDPFRIQATDPDIPLSSRVYQKDESPWTRPHGDVQHAYVQENGNMMIEALWDSGLTMRVIEPPEMDCMSSYADDDAFTIEEDEPLLGGQKGAPHAPWDLLGFLSGCQLDRPSRSRSTSPAPSGWPS